MKYGLLICNNTDNIGDDIQSFAALKYLPSVNYIIDREKMDEFGEECIDRVSAIMNGWYMYSKFRWPPSNKINPLWISVHISRNDYFGIGDKFLDGLGGDYLRQFDSIGARDPSTLNMLRSKKINSYLSGCLTLTIDLPEYSGERSEIILVDIDREDERLIRERYPKSIIHNVTHNVDPNKHQLVSVEKRFKNVEELLLRYKKAKCVITSRLHCALPCLALGTPVLLSYKPEYKDRMDGFLELLHVYEQGNIDDDAMYFDLDNPPANKTDYIKIRNALEDKCCNFIKRAEREEVTPCVDVSPTRIFSWQKELINQMECKFRATINDQIKWIKELEIAKEWNTQHCIEEVKARKTMEEIIAERDKTIEELKKLINNRKKE